MVCSQSSNIDSAHLASLDSKVYQNTITKYGALSYTFIHKKLSP